MVLRETHTLSSVTQLLDDTFCVSIIDREGTITYVNRRFCELSQYTEVELIGRTYGIVNPAYDQDRFLSQLAACTEAKSVWQERIRSTAKDGTAFWVLATVMPVQDAAGRTTHYISVDTDITADQLTSERYTETLQVLHNLQTALDHASVIAVTDPAGVIRYVNPKFCELSQYTEQELVGRTHRIINSGHHPKEFFASMWNTIRNGHIWRGEVKNRAKDGSFYWMNTAIVPFIDSSGKPYEYISIRTDITDRIEAEQSLESALKNDFRTTVKNLQNAIFKYDLDEQGRIRVTLLEGKLCAKIGLTSQALNRKGDGHPFTREEIAYLRPHLYAALDGKPCEFEFTYADLTCIIYLSPVMEDGSVMEVVGTCVDITARKQAERLVEHMAYYDSLTGLANRRLFKSEVAEAIETGGGFSILYLDLDRFKSINDSLGHMIGDKVLKAVAERLTQCLDPDDLACRLGGDEFVLLIRQTAMDRVNATALQIIGEISAPYTFDALEVYVTPSIGISRFPADGQEYDTLMRNADAALFTAKDQGKSTHRFFTDEMNNHMIEMTLLEMELRQALSRGELELHYQPQYEMETRRMTGAEALVRWNHAKKGMISPGQFIPIAEESGLILPIGQWVLETACRQAKEWQDAGLLTGRISVNVSIRQFKQPSFVSCVLSTLDRTGLEPRYLNIEITESMTTDVQYARKILEQLHAEGIRVSIDDFGTGYSSLSYLSTFPITHLKIDQMFLRNLSSSNTAIIKTIIELARNLDIDVIAEGVETEEQAAFLQTLHCGEVQGFLYSRPLPSVALTQLLKETCTSS